jgi:choline dehydrogenase-like flavoprotein
LIVIPLFPGWGAFAIELLMMGPRYLPKFRNFNKYSGIMVKIRDDVRGEIFSDRDFSKPISKNDRKKLKKGVGIMKRILRKLGATTDSIIELPPMGAHPSATCRIGEVVDKNLETSISNLYVCDSSVFPKSLGLPVVWTVVSLGKRLSKHIDKMI